MKTEVKKKMIKQTVFSHGGNLYEYRLHSQKLVNLEPSLSKYLNDVFINCPDIYFESGPRSSSLRFNVGVKTNAVYGHEISLLTKHALNTNKNSPKSRHDKVEHFLLEHDIKTIATEIPLWMHANELAYFKELFKTTKPLTGHVDVLRIEDNKVWIWDYKPNAYKEKYATTQTLFYALMLSKRTGISLKEIRCGYFDDNSAYIFQPEYNLLPSIDLSNFL